MSAAIRRRIFGMMVLCVPLLVMGCHDDDDFRTSDVLDIIDAVGAAVVSIIRAAT